MATETVTQLSTISAGNMAGANVWTDDSAGTTVKTPMRATQVASTLVIRDANGATALAGVQFPNTQVPSADVNMLDDYEEGTFTPTIAGSTVAGTPTYTLQLGTYTKIGNSVRISVYVVWSALTGGTGILVIGGLPFVAANNGIGAFAGIEASGLTFSGQLGAQVVSNTSTIQLTQTVSATPLAGVAAQASGDVRISMTYNV